MKRSILVVLLALFGAATVWAEPAAAPKAGNKKVLMILLDGVRADAVLHVDMPTLHSLINGTWQKGYKAAFTDAGMVVQDAPPHSAPNHVSMATGVTAFKHRVFTNGRTQKGKYQRYPHFLGRLANAFPEFKCGYFYQWKHAGDILSFNDRVIYKRAGDPKMVAEASEFLKTADAVAVSINQPDYYGHKAQYYPRNPSYMMGLASVDRYIKQLLDAVANRPNFDKEDWLITVAADHGGYHYRHGGKPDSGNMTTIPVVIAGKHVKQGMIKGTAYPQDIAVTILEYFGISTRKLDGRKLGDEVQNISIKPLKENLAFYYDFEKNAPEFDGKMLFRETLSCFSVSMRLKESHWQIPASEKLNLANGNNFTLTFWAKIPKYLPTDAILIANKDMKNPANPGLAVIASRVGDEQVDKTAPGICLSIGCKDGKSIEFGQFDRTDGWNFYAVTINENGTMYFCNGAESGYFYHMAYDGRNAVIDSKLPFFAGQDGTGKHPAAFSGEIDDVAFWNRGMSRAELQKIFEAGRKGRDIARILAEE